MEKAVGEEEIKGLEEEIDLAVDRLFVEKRKGLTEGFMMDSQGVEPSSGMVKDLSIESSFQPSPAPIPFIRSIEKMEAQLLTLEWEVTKENIAKTREEVLALQKILKEKQDVTTVLNLMDKVLSQMIQKDENIRPPLIKFLLDSKETIKLLMKKEADRELNIYQQLAYAGIEARFACLEGLRDSRSALSARAGDGQEEIATMGERRIEELLSKMNLFSEKMDELFSKIDQHLSALSQGGERPPEGLADERRPLPVNITVFKVDEKLFAVESEKVVKLFKVPDTFYQRYSNQQKIRLKDIDIRLVDLNKIFLFPRGDQKKEFKILAVKDNNEYKGLMIDDIIKRLSTRPDMRQGGGDYFFATVHSTYQEQPVEIPVLDTRKI